MDVYLCVLCLSALLLRCSARFPLVSQWRGGAVIQTSEACCSLGEFVQQTLSPSLSPALSL